MKHRDGSNRPRHLTYQSGAHADGLAACTLPRSADRAEPAAHTFVRARRRAAGRNAFEQFGNLVSRVVASECGAQRLRAAAKLWYAAQARFDAVFGSQRASDLRALMATVVASDFAASDGPAAELCRFAIARRRRA